MSMTIFSSALKAILSPEKLIRLFVKSSASTDGKSQPNVDGKFLVDGNGSVILNRYNEDVQRAFERNVAGLRTKGK